MLPAKLKQPLMRHLQKVKVFTRTTWPRAMVMSSCRMPCPEVSKRAEAVGLAICVSCGKALSRSEKRQVETASLVGQLDSKGH